MTRTFLIDGDLVPAQEATVNVRDRGFLYGDAAFETLRVYGGVPFAWDAHMERLEGTCATLAFDVDVDRERLRSWVRSAVEANDLDEAAVRVSITRGRQPGTLEPTGPAEPTVVVIVRPLERGGLAREAVEPATAEIVDVRKTPDASMPAHIKTHNYLNGILARLPLAEGTDEAIMRDADGCVTEGTVSNLFIVTDGEVVTPGLDRPVLPGVTRGAVLALAAELDVPHAESSLTPADVYGADEVFLTNTTSEVWPVTAVDDVTFDIGPVTRRLRRAFLTSVEVHHYGDPRAES